MSVLPAGWQVVQLDELTKSESPICYGVLKPGERDPGGVLMVRVKDIGENKFDPSDIITITPDLDREFARSRICGGDVLISVQGTVGRVAVVPDDVAVANISRTIARIRPAEPALREWLWRALLSPQLQISIRERTGGTTRDSLNIGVLKQIEVPLPPLAEQRRIVAKTDGLFAKTNRAREELSHVPRLIEHYKQAILDSAFRGELTANWRSDQGLSVESWEHVTVGDIADVGTGATPKRGEPRYYEGGDIRWVTSGSVNSGYITDTSEFITATAISETNCKIFPPGTILMAMYGEGKTRGKVSILKIEAATNQALAAIQIRDHERIETEYVRWFLHSLYLDIRGKASGGVQPNLNLNIVRSFEIPLPPISEQRIILELVEHAFAWIDRIAHEHDGAAGLIDHLDQSILSKAFRGELVPQDPNDEPASVLLEHIRAERASQPNAKRRGRKPKVA